MALMDAFLIDNFESVKNLNPLLKAIGRRFQPKYPQKDNARVYALLDRCVHCFLFMWLVLTSNFYTQTPYSLLMTLSDDKPADFLVGFLNGKNRRTLKQDVGAKLQLESQQKLNVLVANATAISG